MRRKDREITDGNEVVAIVMKNKTCHIAMVDDGMPYVVPMSYGCGFENGRLTLYFHSAKEGRKIDILHKNPTVCFDICVEKEITIDSENSCHSGRFYESVIGFGHVEFIEDVQEKCNALSRLMHTQSNGGHFTFDEKAASSVCVFKIVVEELTGKRKSPKPPEKSPQEISTDSDNGENGLPPKPVYPAFTNFHKDILIIDDDDLKKWTKTEHFSKFEPQFKLKRDTLWENHSIRRFLKATR